LITNDVLLFGVYQDADKSAKKKAAAASLGGQQEMTPEEIQAEEEVRILTLAQIAFDITRILP
jgi:hypothetical protein